MTTTEIHIKLWLLLAKVIGTAVVLSVLLVGLHALAQMRGGGAYIFSAPTSAYYVSPSGSDSNPGTVASPFATLGKCQTAMQSGFKTCYLRAGTHQLNSAITLTTADNGTLWIGYPGEFPVISGGVPITGWTNTGTNGIWQAPVTAGFHFRELYVNGTHAIRSRGPDLGQRPAGWNFNSAGYTAPDNSMVAFTNQSEVEVVAIGTFDHSRCKVASIVSGSPGATITMATPCWTNLVAWGQRLGNNGGGPWINPLLPTWWENAYELLLTSPCGSGSRCWYLNRSTNTLYYQPAAGENLATTPVIAPSTQHFFTGSGVSNIMFERLTFAYAGNLDFDTVGPGQGYVGIQAGMSCPYNASDQCSHFPIDPMYSLSSPLTFSNSSKGIVFDHCLFTHIAGRPIFFLHSVQNSSITGNLFQDNGGGMAQIGDDLDGTQTNPALFTSGNVFQNNKSVDAPFEYLDVTPLLVGRSFNTLVDHNEIGESPIGGYSPMQVGWGWSTFYDPGALTSYQGGNTITNNYVHDFCELDFMTDCGGVYVNSYNVNTSTPPYIVQGNYAKYTGSDGTNTYYFDNGTQYLTAQGNVANAGVSPQWGGMNDTQNMSVINNWTTQATFSQGCHSGCTYSGNTVYNPASPPTAVTNIIANAGVSASVTPGP